MNIGFAPKVGSADLVGLIVPVGPILFAKITRGLEKIYTKCI